MRDLLVELFALTAHGVPAEMRREHSALSVIDISRGLAMMTPTIDLMFGPGTISLVASEQLQRPCTTTRNRPFAWGINELWELIRPKQIALCALAFAVLLGLFWLIG
jgi:hypothetical protein